MQFSGRLYNHTRDNLLNFKGDLDHHADSPNQEAGQYGNNKLPWPRRSVFAECSCFICKENTSYVIRPTSAIYTEWKFYFLQLLFSYDSFRDTFCEV